MVRDSIPKELASLATSYEVEEVLTEDAMEELGLAGESLEQLGAAAEEDGTEEESEDGEKF